MKNDKDKEIKELFARLEWLDKLFWDQVAKDQLSSALHTLKEASKASGRLKWVIGIQGALVARDRLRDFADGKTELQRVIAGLGLDANPHESDFEWGEKHGWLADSHLNEVLDVEYPEWPNRINERLLEVTILITARPLPEWVVRHLRTLRRCYALGLNDVAWISLRSLIETISYSRLTEENDRANGSQVRLLAERSLQTCLNEIDKRSWVSRGQLQTIRAIVRRANSLVHAKGAIDVPTKPETLEAINAVVSYAHSLHSVGAQEDPTTQ